MGFNHLKYSRSTSNAFNQYKQYINSIICASKTQLLRLDCMNPIKSIALSNRTNNWHNDQKINMNIININNNIITFEGVRHGLFNIFGIFAYNKIVMPKDAYPVYQKTIH